MTMGQDKIHISTSSSYTKFAKRHSACGKLIRDEGHNTVMLLSYIMPHTYTYWVSKDIDYVNRRVCAECIELFPFAVLANL